MCFVLYLGSPVPLPLIPWSEAARGLNTNAISDYEHGVEQHFTAPHICYVGSDLGCGCGFRNASYQNGRWPNEEWRDDDDTGHLTTQPNHEALVKFILGHLPTKAVVELYGAWDGDFETALLSDEGIGIERLLDPDFYFRERGRYTNCLP